MEERGKRKKGGEPGPEALRERLTKAGASFTRQREAVYGFVREAGTHPTAEEVYLGVKARMPKISLATVYKNLEALVGCGAVTKLSYGDGASRYDIRTDPHYHSRCVVCGRITDLEPTASDALRERVRPPAGFSVQEYRIELVGHCKGCRKAS